MPEPSEDLEPSTEVADRAASTQRPWLALIVIAALSLGGGTFISYRLGFKAAASACGDFYFQAGREHQSKVMRRHVPQGMDAEQLEDLIRRGPDVSNPEGVVYDKPSGC